MTSTTRWLSPVASRPADYPAEFPFLSDRGCLLSRSGNGDSELFSLLWPASQMWPADFLRQPRERATGSWEAAFKLGAHTDFGITAADSIAQPDEISRTFHLVCERSREAGWSGRSVGAAWRYQFHSAWFEKGSRVRLVTATAAGVTLEEGLPAQEAARDSA